MRYLVSGLLLITTFVSGEELEVDFARDIRPILSDRCFKCHGLDEGSREAGLALHTFEAATADYGIVPGDADASDIIERMLSDDPDDVMPPPSANKPRLTDDEIAKFKAWINAGAKYEEHWAFISPRENPATTEKIDGHPIDHFVSKAHAKHQTSFSEPAAPSALARRIYLDLIGIPPTTEEVNQFISDYSEAPTQAVSTLADSLMTRPAYGERWAREWLDLARYADTNGYEKDRPRSIWPYRDWVINALNADMPYDQFSIEQLAGDMLPDASLDQRIATGFHRNTMLNEEGGIDPLEYRFHAVVDRVGTTGTVWMGLTTACAQCHTHKFDPITHHDYFGLFALLNNADEPEMDVLTPEQQTAKAGLLKQIDKIRAEASAAHDPQKFAEWKSQKLNQATPWTVITPDEMDSSHPILTLQPDGSIFASGDFTKRDVYTLKFNQPSSQ
ncbi:MAG: DUF1549 domain-containing protein, partial [Verrucomicrobiota bacterium]